MKSLHTTNEWYKVSIKNLLFLLLCCSALSTLNGQSRSELEDKRRKLIKEIEETSKMLDQTKLHKEAAFQRFIALQNQISAREKLIETIEAEMKIVEERIARSVDVIASFELDIANLQAEYGEILRLAYRQKINKTNLYFLFSSKSINEAFKRWRYILQFEEYRKKQAQLIMKTQESLQRKIASLENQRLEKEQLLKVQEKQKKLLLSAFQSKNKILETLKSDENRLVGELQRQKDAHDLLNLAIEEIIQTEIAKNKKKIEEETKNNEGPDGDIGKSITRLDGDFQKNRGKLPWPIKKGIISRRFGTQVHPTIPTLTISNNGIDFLSDPKMSVHAVFEGNLVSKQFIPGYEYTLIVQHGNFYTVYSNLENVYVEQGAVIKTGEALGVAKWDEKVNRSKVHFEIWHNKTRQDPERWLVRN